MKVVDAIAHILKAEGVQYLFAYPVNPLIEAAAKVDIRPIIVRQERVGLHMADALSRLSSGERIGVFCMQYGPGTENAFGGVAQAYGESSPIVVIPGGYPRAQTQLQPNFSAYLNFQHVTKSCEQVVHGSLLADAMRRAFAAVRSGRPRPALVEIPNDVWGEDVPEPLNYVPTRAKRSGPDPADVKRAAELLVAAQRPVIYAGQGVHYARAWGQLRALAELLEAPVTTSLGGKSAFPEDHPLALGSGGRSIPQAVHQFVQAADLIFGVGCSFTTTNFGIKFPKGKRTIHATLDAADIDKEIPCEVGLVGDAALTLDAVIAEVSARLGGRPRGRAGAVAQAIAAVREPWLATWRAKLDSDAVPLSPYRVIRDLLNTVDARNTIITHDAGSPRDQLSPFWVATEPLSYVGWGKTTQLGYGLGLAMGAKLAAPDKLCINVWGDAAIGFTGMDFETAVRERIPIMSVLFNNFSMAIELPVMPVSTEKYRSTDISGRYADMARAFGGYGERVTTPDQIVPAIQRGIAQTQAGVPVLLEFITAKETQISTF